MVIISNWCKQASIQVKLCIPWGLTKNHGGFKLYLMPQDNKKSGNLLIVGAIFIFVLLLLGLGGFLFLNQQKTQTNPIEPVGQVQKPGTPTPSNTVNKTQVDNSTSTSVETDLMAVDNNLTNLDNDLTAVDNGLNDKQTDLSQ